MYSFHYFLFPFRFDYLENEVNDRHDFYKEKAFDERVFKKLPILFEKLKNSEWEYLPFEIKEAEFYNEFVYFHDFVKDSLFNLNESFDKNSTSYFFRKKLNRLKIYLDVKKFSGFEKTYELDLISITLRIFDTGIGILAFEIENHKYENKEDVLNINEYFRRIYPPFVGKGFSFEEVNKKYMANFVIKDENENNESKKYKLDLEKDFQNIKGLKIAPYILKILGEDTFTQNIKEKNKFLIQPVIDERMFVMCWYGNDEMASLAKECWYECKDNEKYWELKDFWYEFLFVDANGKSIANKKIQEELLEKSTYLRWQEYGTLYGISRYSFVNLTSSKETLKRNYADYLIENFKGVYYQLVVLALAIRASVLRFSDEVTAISDLEPDENLYDRVSNLYKNYLKFVNKLYFREVSSQEQAIEIYEIFQNIMRLERDVKDLDNEINKLGSYVYMIQEKEENKEMKDLTKIATIFLPPSLFAGIFGMNVFGEGLTTPNIVSFIFVIIILIGSVLGLPYYMPFILKVMEKISKKGRNDNKTDNTFNSF